jgi:hypothetical protein
MFSQEGQKDGVTPDLSSELENTGSNYGVISESKSSLPKEQKWWKKDVQQLKSYDANFVNWNKPVVTHDIVVVNDVLQTKKFWTYIQELQKEQGFTFDHKLSVLQYTRDTKMDNSSILLRMDYGDISHAKLKDFLENGKRVPMKNLLKQVNSTRFYDHKPTPVYTMEVLWDTIFPILVPVEKYREYPTFGTITIKTSITELTEKLQELCCPKNNPNLLKRDWVEEALQILEEIRLAKHLDEKREKYEVYFRKRPDHVKYTHDFLLNFIFAEGKETAGQTRLDEVIRSNSNS